MSGLSARELAQIREDIEDLLPETAVVLSVTRVSDGGGGWSETWGTASTTICRVDWKSGTEVMSGGAIQPVRACVITLPHDAVVVEGNRIQAGGETYAVTSVDNDKSWVGCVRCEVDKL